MHAKAPDAPDVTALHYAMQLHTYWKNISLLLTNEGRKDEEYTQVTLCTCCISYLIQWQFCLKMASEVISEFGRACLWLSPVCINNELHLPEENSRSKYYVISFVHAMLFIVPPLLLFEEFSSRFAVTVVNKMGMGLNRCSYYNANEGDEWTKVWTLAVVLSQWGVCKACSVDSSSPVLNILLVDIWACTVVTLLQ